MNKLKAYTLAELSVSLIITGMVMTIAVTSLLIVQKQFKEYGDRHQTLHDINLLHSQLKKDMITADSMAWNGNELSCFSSLLNINYTWSQHSVIRNHHQLRSDTFQLNTTLPEVQREKTKNRVTMISFIIWQDQKEWPVVLEKKYAPASVLNPLTNTYLAE